MHAHYTLMAEGSDPNARRELFALFELGSEEGHSHERENVDHQRQDAREVAHTHHGFRHGLHEHPEARPLLRELEEPQQAEAAQRRDGPASDHEPGTTGLEKV